MFASLEQRTADGPPRNFGRSGASASAASSSGSSARSLAGSVSLSVDAASFSFDSLVHASSSGRGSNRARASQSVSGRGLVREEFSSSRSRNRSRSPVARAPAAAPAPVANARADVDNCAVCREHFSSVFDENRALESAKGTTAKQSKARSAMQSSVTDRYRIIFEVELVMRGLIDDNALLPLILKLHHDLIENELARHQIEYEPWTLRMLREHFDPVTGHVFDKVREVAHSLRLIKRTMGDVAARVTTVDSNNPALRTLDHRAAMAHNQLASTHARLVRELATLHAMKDENLADAVFRLVSAIERTEPDIDRLTRDPRAAVGTVTAGGDAREAARVQHNDASVAGSAAAFYQTSGF